MAAYKSEVLLFLILDISGVQKFKMAACKPEVLISQVVDEIEKPFQGQSHHFCGRAT